MLTDVRERMARVMFAALGRVPARWRHRVVARLPRALVPRVTRDAAYFDSLFEPARDPFGFDRNPEETLKFERTLEICGSGPFDLALEIGCAEGAFTALLAPRCKELLAVDISEVAVARARERLRGLEDVRCEVRSLPAEYPQGSFDLVVASDVLYYWPTEDVIAALKAVEASLTPGGVFVALHYVPRMGSLLDGAEVHDLLESNAGLASTLSESREFGPGRLYRIDRFIKSDLP